MEEPIRRRVPFLNFVVSPVRKAYINLAGCNFNCRYCFAIAKSEVGQLLSVEEHLNLFSKSCNLVFGGIAENVRITGGAPTLNPDYLLDLINGLRSISVRNPDLIIFENSKEMEKLKTSSLIVNRGWENINGVEKNKIVVSLEKDLPMPHSGPPFIKTIMLLSEKFRELDVI